MKLNFVTLFCSSKTWQAHAGFFLKVPTKIPANHLFEQNDGFFHNFIYNRDLISLVKSSFTKYPLVRATLPFQLSVCFLGLPKTSYSK